MVPNYITHSAHHLILDNITRENSILNQINPFHNNQKIVLSAEIRAEGTRNPSE